MLMQIILMVALVIMSGFFSATETAFSALNKTRLKSLAEHGDKRAARTLMLAERYDDLLSTILIGNNIVNIALASIGTVFFVALIGGAGVTLSTAVITVVVLIFGEISPKSMAKEAPEAFAMAVTPLIGMLVAVLKPINWLFSKWKALLSRILKIKDDHKVTQDELITMVEEVEQEGGMNAEETELLKSAIEFNDLDVHDILTPRVQVEAVELSDSVQEIVTVFEESGYSRLPVYEETIDRIIGIIHQKDFYHHVVHGNKKTLDVMKSAVFVTGNTKISALLKLMQTKKSQMAVVSDEYGGTEGIVTMEDILEELVGEIWDEHDEVEVEFQENQDGSWVILGSASLEDMKERFPIGEESESTTVGGWVMEGLGCIPEEGQKFTSGGYEITVKKADERRVVEILVRPLPQEEEAAQ